MEEKNTVPVWGGNFFPMRLVTLADDIWNVSLDEINNMCYESTQLFRSSLWIDIGLVKFSLIVLFDGTLVLPRYPKLQKPDARTLFNKHLTDLMLGGLLVSEVAADDVTPGSLNLWGYHRHHTPIGRYSKLSQTLRNRSASPDEAIRLLKPLTITKAEYLLHHKTGRSLSSKLPQSISTVLLPACTAFTNEEWERALILGWTSVELVLENLWNTLVMSGNAVNGITPSRRKDFLSDTRTWSASTRVELLWRMGVLTDAIYASIDRARAARNAFVHSAKSCSPDDAKSALEGTLSLIETVALKNGLAFEWENLMRSLEESTSHFRTPITDATGRLLSEPTHWRYPDPAPGFEDWGDKPFEKRPELRLKPLKEPL